MTTVTPEKHDRHLGSFALKSLNVFLLENASRSEVIATLFKTGRENCWALAERGIGYVLECGNHCIVKDTSKSPFGTNCMRWNGEAFLDILAFEGLDVLSSEPHSD